MRHARCGGSNSRDRAEETAEAKRGPTWTPGRKKKAVLGDEETVAGREDEEVPLGDPAELSLEPEDFVGKCARQNSLPSTADSGQRFQPGPRPRHRDDILSFFNPSILCVANY